MISFLSLLLVNIRGSIFEFIKFGNLIFSKIFGGVGFFLKKLFLIILSNIQKFFEIILKLIDLNKN